MSPKCSRYSNKIIRIMDKTHKGKLLNKVNQNKVCKFQVLNLEHKLHKQVKIQ